MESVRDKVVLITGASDGIGARTAVLFAKHGSKLALTGRNAENLDKVIAECCEWGLAKEKIIPIIVDFGKRDGIDNVVDEVIKKFNRLDVLVNNAAANLAKNVQQVTMEEMDNIFQVNVKAVVQLTKAAIPHLKASKGCIVNVSSALGTRPMIGLAIYSMTKAALDSFTSALVLELSQDGVRVNSVNPGFIRTNSHIKAGVLTEENYDQVVEMIGSQYPACRVGRPEEVASAILYLASDAASFVNGLKMNVDGGVLQTSSWYPGEIASLPKTD